MKPDSAQNVGARCSVQNDFCNFNRTKKTGYGYWVMSFSVTMKADFVPPDQIEKHREFVERVWRESSWSIISPLGCSKPKQKRDFGALPPAKLVQTTPARHFSENPGSQNNLADASLNHLTEKPIPAVSHSETIFQPAKTPSNIKQQVANKTQRKTYHPKSKPVLNYNQTKLVKVVIVAGAILLLFILILAAISSGDRAPH